MGETAGHVLRVKADASGLERGAAQLIETAGPTLLTPGAIADGEYLKRSGSTIIGGTPSSGGGGEPIIVRPEGQYGGWSTCYGVSEQACAIYLCRAQRAYSGAKVIYYVSTGGGSISWAEVAIFKGALALGADASMILVGYVDQAANFGNIGVHIATITGTIALGDHLWVAWATSASSTPEFRAFTPDPFNSGLCQYRNSTRPSTMGAGTLFAAFNTNETMFCLVELVP